MPDRAIADLYGLPPGELRSVSQIQHLALARRGASWNGDNAVCTHLLRPMMEAADPFDAVLHWNVAGPLFDPLVHLLLEVILAAVPFRHEAYWVEVRAPHWLWLSADGMWDRHPLPLFEPDAEPVRVSSQPFVDQLARARGLRRALTAMGIHDGPVWDAQAAQPLQTPERLNDGCGAALDVLLRAYLAGETAVLDAALAHTEDSSSRVVRCAREAITEARQAHPKSRAGAHLANARRRLR